MVMSGEQIAEEDLLTLFEPARWTGCGEAAFEVGYESASQFNREYRRFFKEPDWGQVDS